MTTKVASFTDAWIETEIASISILVSLVASFTDAWIETFFCIVSGKLICVASFTDAWIETGDMCVPSLPGKSHLLQMRGLKQNCQVKTESVEPSHLLQMRGLKLAKNALICKRHFVASFTDAWIETLLNTSPSLNVICRIFYRCVD